MFFFTIFSNIINIINIPYIQTGGESYTAFVRGVMNGFDFLNIIEILCIRFSKLRNITYIPMITFIRNIQNIQDPKTGKYVTNRAISIQFDTTPAHLDLSDCYVALQRQLPKH